ncbi:MAG: hypothetical protein BWY99_02015 [Synergistetes bacterium ADurb.BinA166]|nr:MAG: hypothetical protein BWY99_02015 [Synergistetes bacterium ADurb.BinA166]
MDGGCELRILEASLPPFQDVGPQFFVIGPRLKPDVPFDHVELSVTLAVIAPDAAANPKLVVRRIVSGHTHSTPSEMMTATRPMRAERMHTAMSIHLVRMDAREAGRVTKAESLYPAPGSTGGGSGSIKGISKSPALRSTAIGRGAKVPREVLRGPPHRSQYVRVLSERSPHGMQKRGSSDTVPITPGVVRSRLRFEGLIMDVTVQGPRLISRRERGLAALRALTHEEG